MESHTEFIQAIEDLQSFSVPFQLEIDGKVKTLMKKKTRKGSLRSNSDTTVVDFPGVTMSEFKEKIWKPLADYMLKKHTIELRPEGCPKEDKLKYNKTTEDSVLYRRLICANRKKGTTKSTSRESKTRSKRFSNCRFAITFIYCTNRSLWEVGNIINEHAGHMKKLHSNKKPDKELKQMVKDMVNIDIMPVSSINSYMKRLGITMTNKDISNIAREAGGKTVSDSEVLLDHLSKSEKLISIVKFKTMRRNPANSKKDTQCGEEKTVFKVPGHEWITIDRLSKKRISEMLENVKETVNDTSLVKDLPSDCYITPTSFVWVPVATLRIGELFGEVIQVDATSKTNSQRRPLIFITGEDSQKRSICLATCIVLSESKENYSFVVNDVLLRLYGLEFMQRICTIVTDGDSILYDLIDEFIRSGVLNKGLVRLRCYWHLVTSSLTKKITNCNDFEFLVRTSLQNWFGHLYKYPENAIEYDLIWKKLIEFLESIDGLSRERYAAIRKVVDELNDTRGYWSLAFNSSTRNFDTNTTSRGEGENSALKKYDVSASTSLERVNAADTCRQDIRTVERELADDRTATTAPLVIPMDDNPAVEKTYDLVNSSEELEWQRHLTRYALDAVNEQRVLSTRYDVKRISENKLEVCYKGSVADKKMRITKAAHKLDFSLPKFKRKRVVTLSNGVLVCSCPMSARMALPCRHLIRVRCGSLSLVDFHPRWTIHYASGKVPFKRYFNDNVPFRGSFEQLEVPDFENSKSSIDLDPLQDEGDIENDCDFGEDLPSSDSELILQNFDSLEHNKSLTGRYKHVLAMKGELIDEIEAAYHDEMRHFTTTEDVQFVASEVESIRSVIAEFRENLRSKMSQSKSTTTSQIQDAPHIRDQSRNNKRTKASHEGGKRRRVSSTQATKVRLPENLEELEPSKTKGRPSSSLSATTSTRTDLFNSPQGHLKTTGKPN